MMKFCVVDTHMAMIIARFRVEAHAATYVKWLNEKLKQPNRHIVVEE